jgi:RNA polymerase sigma factor (sigma-70 family)
MMEEVRILSESEPTSQGDWDLLERLYRSEYDGMVRLAITLVSDVGEAEEIVQDSFVEVHRRLETIRKPGAYLRSSVVSRCRSALRRRRVMDVRPSDPPAQLSTSACEVWDVLSELTEDQRLAVVLRYYGGYRLSEIAAIVDKPAPTVRSHLRRGLAVLRRELEQ